MAKVTDWESIKTEYITSNISYRKLADKKGVSFRTLSERAAAEKWREQRKACQDKVREQTVKEYSKIAAKENAKKLVVLQKTADKVGTVLSDVVNRIDKEFSEAEVGALGTKTVKELTGALKDLAYVIRNVYDIPTSREQQELDIANERLKLDKEKANNGGADEKETGVVLIAPVLEDEDDE